VLLSVIRLTDAKLLFWPAAWYDSKDNTIFIDERLKPFWLVLLHELGHYFIGYFPQTIYYMVSLDSEWDNLWVKLRLNYFFKLEVS